MCHMPSTSTTCNIIDFYVYLMFFSMYFYGSFYFFFFSSRRRHTRCSRDWSSDVCSSDLIEDTARREWIRPAVQQLAAGSARSEERREGKSVDLGGRRIIKKKKTKKERERRNERRNED